MEIRRATARDAGIVARLNREVQQLHADALPRLFKPPSGEIFAPAAFADLVADPETVVFIGEAGGEPVGYLYAQVARRPDTPFTHASDVVVVHHLAVRREHRGRGYGERLIREAVALAESEGIRRLELSVWAFNTDARGFFARQGFTVFNERMCLEQGEGQSW